MIPGLSKDPILDHPIDLPPLAEQLRIVAKIEELFSDLEDGVASLIKAKEQLKAFRKGILQSIYEGADPETGIFAKKPPISIHDIIDEIGQGWSPQCEYENSDDSSERAVIKTTAIQEMNFHDYENKILPKT